MKILVLGSGGREHAIAWKLNESARVSRIYCAPGNPGTAKFATNVPLKLTPLEAVADFAAGEGIDLTVVGPEQPLADGIVDLFRQRGLAIFGPTRAAAELEWSKKFAKDFMRRHAIPTAAYASFGSGDLAGAKEYIEGSPLPVVLKADGLAAGKGVVICQTRGEALQALHDMAEARVFGTAGSTVVVEEFMTGQEASVFAVCDGARFVMLAPAQDHKRVFDGDRGKNTGGMGAYAPTPFVTPEISRIVEERIILPTLQGMASEGRPYSGCLYVGLMLTGDGPKVVEYNCRFGDPETQVVVPLYGGDFAELLRKSAAGDLAEIVPTIRSGHAVCVVLASQGYPDAYRTGLPIAGLEKAESLPGVAVFHAGTRTEAGEVVTAGGRVLGVTARVSGSLQEAVDRAYEGVNQVSFAGVHFRRDIARKAFLASDRKQ
jgi:phosphoribosylamine---glycine ligase